MKKLYTYIVSFLFLTNINYAQNSMVGDGFGGRLWYNPTNYTVGSYSAYSLCYDICGTGETQLYGWGDNNTNQLGLGISVWGDSIPRPIPNMNNVTYYSTGYIMGAIKNDSTGWAWGNGIEYPTQVITGVKFLDASSSTISFVKYDGTVWSIGANSGNFGDSLGNSSDSIPIKMLNITNAVRVATSSNSNTILLNDSTLMAVGSNNGLGTGILFTNIPMPISGLPKIIDIKSNAQGTIALSDNGNVYFWGYENYSGLVYNSPIIIPNLSNIVAISGCDDGYHFMALDENKNCYAWGDNWGQFGIDDSILNTDAPQVVETDIIDIMAGETFSYIVKSDGSLWASGSGGIWLNLPQDTFSETFIQLDPSQVAGACELVGITPTFSPYCNATTQGSITIDNFGGQAPFTYSIGGAFQSSNIFTFQDTGVYIITVKDANNCQYSTTAQINGENCVPVPPPTTTEPLPQPINAFIDFVNVFSPNNDGFNDVFYFPSEGITEFNCKIYNRWGLLLYEYSEVKEGWNGRTNSKVECPDGTYYFIANYKLLNAETKTEKRFFTLLR